MDIRKLKRRQKTKELEYEEAPSGYVTLYHYKEPFMKFKEGFGFDGVLLFDGESDKIQCHFCGKWFDSLGNHINKEHGMTASEYKAQVGLMSTTALINEKTRAKLIESGQERFKNLKNRKGKKVSIETRKKIAESLRKNRIEMRNIHGTCPAQLLDRLRMAYHNANGNFKTKNHVSKGLYKTIVNTYGTFKQACELANIPYRKAGTNARYEWNEDKLIYWIRDNFNNNKKVPRNCVPKAMQFVKKSGKDWNWYVQEALAQDGEYKKAECIVRYTKENLLKFIRTFEKIHGRIPSYSDSKRGLLPPLSRYSYNFGSWKKALKLALNK